MRRCVVPVRCRWFHSCYAGATRSPRHSHSGREQSHTKLHRLHIAFIPPLLLLFKYSRGTTTLLSSRSNLKEPIEWAVRRAMARNQQKLVEKTNGQRMAKAFQTWPLHNLRFLAPSVRTSSGLTEAQVKNGILHFIRGHLHLQGRRHRGGNRIKKNEIRKKYDDQSPRFK